MSGHFNDKAASTLHLLVQTDPAENRFTYTTSFPRIVYMNISVLYCSLSSNFNIKFLD